MKGMLFAAVFAACALAVPAQADTTATPAKKPLTAQQQKMKDCNAEASSKQLKGDARKTFMAQCLHAGAAGAAAADNAKGSALPELSSQEKKMKECNVEAKQKNLKGAERKTFMKTCLSGSH